ncbi:hypothetical protein FWK35_00016719 [Aphis craccivora]|uniref:Secreted protein n=1 Tax=Aphis craccivora TaxID=307492 RepID=A0A6G0Z3E0_APHCR|nr:hypothetical protein FWK35_00016719 [Aphis craccivora]
MCIFCMVFLLVLYYDCRASFEFFSVIIFERPSSAKELSSVYNFKECKLINCALTVDCILFTCGIFLVDVLLFLPYNKTAQVCPWRVLLQ